MMVREDFFPYFHFDIPLSFEIEIWAVEHIANVPLLSWTTAILAGHASRESLSLLILSIARIERVDEPC